MKRYIFTGAPGVGKTTLLEGLAALGYPVVAEAATDVIATEQAAGVDKPWIRARFISDVLKVQMVRQAEVVPAPVVLFDRSPFCTLALARYLSRPIPSELNDEVTRLVTEGFYERDVFLVRPVGRVEATAARRISYEDSLAFEAVHESTYQSFGFTLVAVAPTTSQIRVAAVDDALATLTGRDPKSAYSR